MFLCFTEARNRNDVSHSALNLKPRRNRRVPPPDQCLAGGEAGHLSGGAPYASPGQGAEGSVGKESAAVIFGPDEADPVSRLRVGAVPGRTAAVACHAHGTVAGADREVLGLLVFSTRGAEIHTA